MIRDKQLELSNSQAITATAAATNKIDLGPNSPFGNSNGQFNQDMPLIGAVTEAFTADGAATLAIAVRSSNNADMSSPKTHYTTAAVPKASLVIGADLAALFGDLRIPPRALRYVDVNYVVATGPFTAGKITLGGATARQTAS